MHLAMIIDDERLRHEQSMLNRLSIGLMAEGVQLSRIVPNTSSGELVDVAEQRVALASRIETSMKVLPWMRQSRANRIAESFGKTLPDVLYAIGEMAWLVGADLAQALERPLVIDVCSMMQARTAPQPARGSFIAGYIAPSQPMADVLVRRFSAAMVHLVPLGIASPSETAAVTLDSQQTIAMAIIGNAADLSAYSAMLEGISRVAGNIATLQIFLELQGPHEHEIWRRAEQLNLLPYVSAIADAATYRSLLTHCDLLLMPERRGELRSLMIEAMALGLPVIAGEDSALDLLIEDKTSIVVKRATASEWAERIGAVLNDPASARKIALQARELVLQRNRSSDQVFKLLQALETIVHSSHLRLSPSVS